jgi:enolase-phosphatase E1
MTRLVLLDLEGTTIPIHFVYETLFPMARDRSEAFFEARHADPEVHQALCALARESAGDAPHGAPSVPSPGDADFLYKTRDYYLWLMAQDRKSTPLKRIQGLIWQEAFETNQIRCPVFADVPAAFGRWTNGGWTIAIYSSGSVLAQKLVMRYSEAGDLTGSIARYIDTSIGHKKEAVSYARIAQSLGVAAGEILFLSDIPAELDAARSAGVQPILCMRPGNAPVADVQAWASIHSFDEI